MNASAHDESGFAFFDFLLGASFTFFFSGAGGCASLPAYVVVAPCFRRQQQQ